MDHRLHFPLGSQQVNGAALRLGPVGIGEVDVAVGRLADVVWLEEFFIFVEHLGVGRTVGADPVADDLVVVGGGADQAAVDTHAGSIHAAGFIQPYCRLAAFIQTQDLSRLAERCEIQLLRL